MSQTYFQFKQFTIQQEKCAMKVCTDACIFGSWVANYFPDKKNIKQVLDIGTGTGLLSLMFAQKNHEAIIDSIEIEKNAAEQAKENFLNSPWNERLNIFFEDVKHFYENKKYDLIICNPPFFEDDLTSAHDNINIAKHNAGLTFRELINVVKQHLDLSGYFAVLLPYHRINYFEELATENKFFLKEKFLIRQTPAHNFFRGILLFSYNEGEAITTGLVIKNQDEYTIEFKGLLQDYYLNL